MTEPMMTFVSSWDDGHPLDEKLGDLLLRYGFRGTFFVPIRNAEGLPVLDPPAVRRLSAEHEIGSHTYDHLCLRGLTAEVVHRQVREGKTALADILGRPVLGFCYPRGYFEPAVTRAVRDAGFHYARTVENLVVGGVISRFHVGTTLQFYPHRVRVLARNLLKYPHRSAKVKLLARLVRSSRFDDRLKAAATYARDHGGILHIWGHSWELERHQLWRQLENFLIWLRDLEPRNQLLHDVVQTSKAPS